MANTSDILNYHRNFTKQAVDICSICGITIIAKRERDQEDDTKRLSIRIHENSFPGAINQRVYESGKNPRL